jgi:tetratricopeptide (TPR) repeat protein
VILNLAGRKNEAIACYDKSISIYPKYIDAFNNKGINFTINRRRFIGIK